MNFQVENITNEQENTFAKNWRHIRPDAFDIDYWDWNTPEGKEYQKQYIDFTVYTPDEDITVDVKGGDYFKERNKVPFEVELYKDKEGTQPLPAFLPNTKADYHCYIDEDNHMAYLSRIKDVKLLYEEYKSDPCKFWKFLNRENDKIGVYPNDETNPWTGEIIKKKLHTDKEQSPLHPDAPIRYSKFFSVHIDILTAFGITEVIHLL